MAYFLAGVANAEIFKGNDLFSTAKTLIDSSITIGVSAEDIRAGQGAKLYGKYFHTSTFDLKMTDAMFRLDYLAANVGSDLELGGEVFTEEEHVATGKTGTFKLAKKPKPMNDGDEKLYIYWKKSSDSYYTISVHDVTAVTTSEVTLNSNGAAVEFEDKAKYCIKYLYTNDLARKVTVKANFTPDTLSVYLQANLYSGDVANPQTGTKIGTVTIKVPRFLLNGSQEIAMSMTGAANTPFEGSALAAKGEGCDGDGIYAEIIEVINDRTYKDLKAIVVEDSEDFAKMKQGETKEIRVFGRFEDTAPALIPASQVTGEDTSKKITVADGILTVADDATATDTTVTITVKDGPEKVKAELKITVEAKA